MVRLAGSRSLETIIARASFPLILNKLEVNLNLLKTETENSISAIQANPVNIPFGQVYVSQDLARVFEK